MKKNLKDIKSLEDFNALDFETIQDLTDEEIAELMKIEAIKVRFSGLNIGNDIVYAWCGYGCDTTSGGSGQHCYSC